MLELVGERSGRSILIRLCLVLAWVAGANAAHGQCAASFSPTVNYGTGNGANSVAAGDFDSDTRADLAVVNYSAGTVSVLLGNGAGTFLPAVQYGAGSSPYFVAVGDLNSDNRLDLVAVNDMASNNVSVLLGNGNGTFGAATAFNAGDRPH